MSDERAADPRAVVRMIVGPTASGKTRQAIDEALRVGGEVVSADSRCVYRGLDIGTAKPTDEEQQGVRHHFVDERDLGEPFSAGIFAHEAETRISEMLERGRTPIVAGGSTLYLSALRDGLAEMPDVPPSVRERLTARLETEGLPALVADLRHLDPALAARLDLRNPARVLRGLEVVTASGTPLSVWQARRPTPRFRYDVTLLAPPLDVLDRRIDARVGAMVEAGWVGEVAGLLGRGVSPTLEPLRTIGYREMADVVQGRLSLAEAVELIQTRTRQYARRQLRYFRSRFGFGGQ